jgi:GNAT superfamily N-acetyltransferase
MMDLVIRERREEDVTACTRLAQLVHDLDGYPPYLSGELRDFMQSPDAIGAWVAEFDGDIVGHVALHARSSDAVMGLASAASGHPPGRFGVVARLLVSPAARQGGVGRALLRTATVHAVELGLYPVLDVVTRFLPAIALYESCGWIRAGVVTIPLPDGTSVDEFVYLGPSAATSP